MYYYNIFKKCVKNSIIFQEMKISEKFDFVMEYLKKIGGGEFMRYVWLNMFFQKKKNEITIQFNLKTY